jgi:hypothetical protein
MEFWLVHKTIQRSNMNDDSLEPINKTWSIVSHFSYRGGEHCPSKAGLEVVVSFLLK